jgi:hypothetical protein
MGHARAYFVSGREKEIGGSGVSLEPPGPLLTHLHTVYMVYPECLPTRLNPLAERTCLSQASGLLGDGRAQTWAAASLLCAPIYSLVMLHTTQTGGV